MTEPLNTSRIPVSLWQRWKAGLTSLRPHDNAPPLRAELFSVDQLARHARELASTHRIASRPGPDRLLARLDQNEEDLRAFNRSTLSVDPGRRITPAAEWLLDNFYLLEEQIQMARLHLPRGYSRELPRLLPATGPGYPRVYDIVLALISHSDAQIDATPLSAFIAAYQSVTPLTLGELWAIPIMLRLGVIENLQRITTRLAVARTDRDSADAWVDRLQAQAETNVTRLVIVVADLAKADVRLSSSFVAEFCQRLSRQSPVLHLARNWLEQRLLEAGSSIEQQVQLENQNQAADQVSVSHSISSLRFLSSMDWKEFVETLSQVDATLRSDPAGVYGHMDFTTRDSYRHAVESLARHSGLSEGAVAQQAIDLASEASRIQGHHHRTAHVGYFLIDHGRATLGRLVRVCWPWRIRLEQVIHQFPLAFYLGGIGTLTGLGTAMFWRGASGLGLSGAAHGVFTGLFLLCVSQIAVAAMNWLSTVLVQPRVLPRLDFSTGIAPGCRTMVVVPTLLTSAEGVEGLIDMLEIHHLANRDPLLHFGLLTDFRDAATSTLPGDDALLQRARHGIEQLNRRYPTEHGDRFFLFHRPRRWNESEGRWMGHERKRGKLAEFNGLLRGGSAGCFSEVVGNTGVLPSVQYVITLDTDTQLPRDAARHLIGTLAHRLNRPEFDPVRRIVNEGYGILQPRVAVSLPCARRSWFVRLFAGDVGIDPYTRAISDVYQDLFSEGSFIGKGIYDVDAFEHALAGRLPENAVLSHDLLEACHARSALVSDVELYEEYPSRYTVDVDRRHRWIRGDWQITPWLLPRVPGSDARRVANPLSALSRWKIFDNLRRSLVPAALLFLLLGAWMFLDRLGAAGTLTVLGMIVLPGCFSVAIDALRKHEDLPLALHLRGVAASGGRQLGQMMVTLAFLPYDAYISLDAIVRTLIRVLVTRRRLLQWKTSSDAEQTTRTDLAGFYRTMWVAPTLAVIVGLLLGTRQATQLSLALPFLVFWCLAPGIAWWISRPIDSSSPGLSGSQQRFLRRLSRKTWHFFETFVTAQEHWLPPDNVQEVPGPTIATRTSPTNMGLALLANLAARDFGYISTGTLIQRTRDTLATLHGLERHRGHFYNWYDTRTLQPLLPVYVSSVDSGNLAGHLLTLGAGLREQMDEPLYTPELFRGIGDTLAVLQELLPSDPSLARLASDLEHAPASLGPALALLARATETTARLVAVTRDDRDEARGRWIQALDRNCRDHLTDLRHLAPWLDQPASAPVGAAATSGETGSAETTLRDLAGPGPTSEKASAEGVAPIPFPEGARSVARERVAELERLARQCDELAAMDFGFLFDPQRKLFSIGYNKTEHRRDPSYYDLLASESRLGSYVAIALGQVPQDHWFSLGRLLVAVRGEPILVSWSGSMFEYLMPLLVMPNFGQTLLDHSCRAAVQQQIDYGRLRGVPWGVSESGYHRTDVHLNYQYRAFGVPGLGLKRGLAEDLVVAPYATAMALMIDPKRSCENLQRLAGDGLDGPYGLYEAIDYTPARLPPDSSSAVIRSFMAHHQGMSLLALDDVIGLHPMQRRFLACPLLKAAELLLQERVPRTAARVFVDDLALETTRALPAEGESGMRIFTQASLPAPEVHLLSNGRYHVVISHAGGGYSRWRDLAVTRWREDGTRDCWGSFIYVRDTATGVYWSAAHQPTLQALKGAEAIFTPARAEFRVRPPGLEMHTEISVSPEDDVELRRVTVVNRSSVIRTLEFTSYAEVVLAPAAADAAHPAFSNLFVQTEFIPGSSALLCARRPRSPEEAPPCLIHVMRGPDGATGGLSCETDRSRFVGRGGTLVQPAALQGSAPLSNTVGPVLDPIVSLRRTVSVAPDETVVIDFILGVAENRRAALTLVEKYQNMRMADRAFDLAWTHSQVTLRHLNVSEIEARLYGRLAGALVYADHARRASAGVLRSNRRAQDGLWSYGISGDAPIVLLRLSDPAKIELARQLILAHSYWRMKGLTVDLVILNEDISVYRQSLHDDVLRLIASGIEAQLMDKPGGIFVRRLEQIPQEDRVLLHAMARISLDDERGTLAEQWEHRGTIDPPIPAFAPTRTRAVSPAPVLAARELILRNGLGGFTPDGNEYVITLQPGESTPAPWCNVLANPSFGTLVSESGSAYTWLENAHEFRLTPWHNDPVQDPAGEALYLRDEQTGEVWSPTPGPARGATPYVIRHGFGYTVFEHTEYGITSEVWVYVAMDAPVKVTLIKLRNASGRHRRISVTSYCEWVLGDLRPKSLLHVQTEVDLRTGALLARNPAHTEFAGRIVFLDVSDPARTVTGDRKEFIGRNGTLAQPAALRRVRLSGKAGAGLDPCGATQVMLDLEDGQQRETSVRLGAGRSLGEVQTLIHRFRQSDAGRLALERVWAHWGRVLGAVHVDTPDPAVNVMANGWLLYQTLSCRLWGRTGFYQSGGAYGFRDQLQDSLALVHATPALTREHLLRAAARQFREGDVQHWWHPPLGRGVRTRFSDDFLWLPYATCRYVTAVGDTGVLDETVSYLAGRPVKPEEEAYYDLPAPAEETGTLYDHCVRAIENGLKFGAHGLPLMGCGDWNDGMNRVGIEGRGESVWLAFFLFDVLTQFADLALSRGQTAFAERCRREAQTLRDNLERHAWDGDWYLRAWFDHGDTLGSHRNAECQIDALPQSWSVISGAGDPVRSLQAMRSVDRRLVRRDAALIQLFDPPFDVSTQDPGYIKGYIPGVRENGGQYTHAAIWTTMAFALLGEHDRAWELFGLLNPPNHSATPGQADLYKVEPYVVAADVYAVPPHVGRGGWTWYTGSAGWMYRLLVETLLGLNLEGEELRFEPRLPGAWPACRFRYRYR
ncbi:MAG: hypothetical protein JNJ82_01170, partial [Opitutaceae bacterium]|nr:hypothetical protein [Opitutaceae bacterium]